MDRLLRLRFHMLRLLSLAYLAATLAGVLLLWLFTPERLFAVYPAVYVFYWLCGVAMTWFLDKCRANHHDRLLNVFMIFHGVKFLLTILLLIAGVLVLQLPKVVFSVSLIFNYFVYSGLELYIYHRYNHRVTTGKWN
jgi:hypothetical protein